MVRSCRLCRDYGLRVKREHSQYGNAVISRVREEITMTSWWLQRYLWRGTRKTPYIDYVVLEWRMLRLGVWSSHPSGTRNPIVSRSTTTLHQSPPAMPPRRIGTRGSHKPRRGLDLNHRAEQPHKVVLNEKPALKRRSQKGLNAKGARMTDSTFVIHTRWLRLSSGPSGDLRT